ncbi:WD repeat domain phosphoinositide-interacting protein 4 [Leptinotarsa decemlineata]|uniref:WD repeat domain phosphoinositide-interacting protein 4 n=1 Tax=Leptinotarsa decemlineata TaxID=7539 RepID=UPI000C2539BA|nr:WD repeat domain phosphoinositide-interacting protein 4 [Leptinotarsa decemlineata]
MSNAREVLSVRFNQDFSCFSCSTESGVRIYNVNPLVEKINFGITTVGSVSKCEMLNRSNLLAIVSGGTRPKFPDNHLLIYDDLAKKFILDISFKSTVLSVRLKKDKLVVVLKSQIHIFSFPSPTQKLFTIFTRDNPKGLCEIGTLPNTERNILVYPGFKTGSVDIWEPHSMSKNLSSAKNRIDAHQTDVRCMVLNSTSTKLATASQRGTLIRIWDIIMKQQLLELRRGSDPAIISCLNFSKNSEYLCCCSDKETVHIFAVKDTQLNKRLSIKSKTLGSYASSQWGLTGFKVPQETAAECAFGENNSVIVICLDGSFYKYSFTPEGKNHREQYDIYLDCDDDEEFFI